jgi:hypothetical protein
MSPEDVAYARIPDYPGEVCSSAILARLIDGLGFRFRWASEDLGEKEARFRPSPESMNILEITGHVWGLVNWITISITDRKPERPTGFPALRASVLALLVELRRDIAAKDDDALRACTLEGNPFWHLINGPLSDALTHVGQINAFRRLAGNPTPKANVFRGLPPG